MGFTGFYRVLPGFTGFLPVLNGFYRVLLFFTGFSWLQLVLPGFTGFYLVFFFWSRGDCPGRPLSLASCYSKSLQGRGKISRATGCATSEKKNQRRFENKKEEQE